MTAGEIGQIELLALFDVLLRSAEAFGEAGIVEGHAGAAYHRPPGLCQVFLRLHLRPLPYQPQLRVNHPLILQPHALQIGQDFVSPLLQRGLKIGVLPAHRVAVAGVHHRHPVLEGPLEFRHAAQELHFILLQLLFPFHVPLGPARADVLHLLVALVRESDASRQLRYRAIILIQRFQRRVDALHHLAIKYHLFAHVPVEHARHQPLPPLHQRIHRPARPRVHRADGSDLRRCRIARVHQRQQIGERHIAGRGALGMARAHTLPDLSQDGDQLSAFHGTPSGSGSS